MYHKAEGPEILNKKEKAKDAYLKQRYGISYDDFKAILKAQGNRCPICLRIFNFTTIKPCVDHDHRKGGVVRGILCSYDNHYVVGRHTDYEKIQRVADYLKGPHTSFIVPKKKRRTKSPPIS